MPPDFETEVNALQGRIRALEAQRDALLAGLQTMAVHGPPLIDLNPTVVIDGAKDSADFAFRLESFYSGYIYRIAARVREHARETIARAGL